jgi:hypothetical protein
MDLRKRIFAETANSTPGNKMEHRQDACATLKGSVQKRQSGMKSKLKFVLQLLKTLTADPFN